MADSFQYGEFDTRLRSVVHAIALIVAAFAVGIALVIVAFNLLSLVGFTFTTEAEIPASIRALSTALQFVGFALVGFLYLRWRDDQIPLFRMGVPGLRGLGWIVGGFVGLFVIYAILGNIINALGIQVAENAAVTQGRSQPTFFLYLIPIAFLFNAPAEEFLFRGIVQGLFRRAYGVVPGIVLASLLFGVVHYVALGGTGSRLIYVVIAVVLGLVLGALYERTENLTVPILVHGGFNAVQFSVAYLAATGQIPS